MDKRTGNTPPAQFKRETAPVKLDAGPYIGKIKNNLDPTRSGRLQVYLPDVAGGDEENPDNWRTVSYASPFFGSTATPGLSWKGIVSLLITRYSPCSTEANPIL